MVDLLHLAEQCGAELFAAEVVEDVTPRQLAVLKALGAKEGVSQTKLVEATGVDRSTLADLCKRMQRKGLLRRRRTREDARAYAVQLTDEGRRVLKVAAPAARRVDEILLSALSDKGRRAFLAALASIVESFSSEA